VSVALRAAAIDRLLCGIHGANLAEAGQVNQMLVSPAALKLRLVNLAAGE
jgi:hypothetical protein